jgi:hypothetical protein
MALRSFRAAAGRLLAVFAFAAAIAIPATTIGSRDLESYEHVVFSLDRGTAVQSVELLGQPVYTLGIGLGVRMPLQGNLGASPVARLARYASTPLTYWLLLTFTIATAILLMRQALQPLCPAWCAWMAAALLFCSVPMVAYAFFGDWPEVVVTYCTIVGCVFAPHALLTLLERAPSALERRIAWVAVAATVCALVALAHPGYWPLVAICLVASGILTLCRTDAPMRTRIGIGIALGMVAAIPVALQAPDILRETAIADSEGMRRLIQGPGRQFLVVNLFPFLHLAREDPEMPFGLSVLALVAIVAGTISGRGHLRNLTIASGLISLALAIASATLSPGDSLLAPSSIWALRDVATVFAVLAAATAAGTARVPVLAVLLIAGLQGPAYAVSLLVQHFPDMEGHRAWTRDASPADARAIRRGLTGNGVSPGGRLALWPDVRNGMRNRRQSSTDLADAGYPVVSAWTKQRTMRQVVEPNDVMFNQVIELSPGVLCDPQAVQFLQLRYLLRPAEAVPCGSWTPRGPPEVDEWLAVDINATPDARVRAMPVTHLDEAVSRRPALSAGSNLIPLLTPLPDSSLTITSTNVVVRLDELSGAAQQALVLPVVYDSALRPSSGELRNAGGLAALVNVQEPVVTIDFVPDMPAVLRAVAFTLAQVLAVAGMLALGVIGGRDAGRRRDAIAPQAATQ